MKVLVTGAGGFVGGELVNRLLSMPALGGHPIAEVVSLDTRLDERADPRHVAVVGSIADKDVLAQALRRAPDCVFHLAAVPGGAVAANYALGWSVNVEATVALFEGLAAHKSPARVVFTGSIGVFGVPLPKDKVDDQTLPLPTMSYGTHKLIGEALLADFTRRGLIEGVAVRLPGIVARPMVKGGHLSAYMSNIFHALASGQEICVPVSRQATSWFMSRQRCVDNLLHAATLPPGSVERAFNLPALTLGMDELVAGIAAHFGPDVGKLVSYEPQPAIEAQFGSYPRLLTPIADGLGFMDDGDAAMLVARALDLDSSRQRTAR